MSQNKNNDLAVLRLLADAMLRLDALDAAVRDLDRASTREEDAIMDIVGQIIRMAHDEAEQLCIDARGGACLHAGKRRPDLSWNYATQARQYQDKLLKIEGRTTLARNPSA